VVNEAISNCREVVLALDFVDDLRETVLHIP
jgi:hypothetical protein